MRFIFGIVVGAILVVGAAYIHDAAIDPVRGSVPRSAWSIGRSCRENMRGLSDWLRDQWAWLEQPVAPPGVRADQVRFPRRHVRYFKRNRLSSQTRAERLGGCCPMLRHGSVTMGRISGEAVA